MNDIPKAWVVCCRKLACVETRLFSNAAEAVALWNSLPRREDVQLRPGLLLDVPCHPGCAATEDCAAVNAVAEAASDHDERLDPRSTWNSLPRRDDPREVTMDMMEQAIERKRMRFEAAVAAMAGFNANSQLMAYKAEALARFAVEGADALLAELAKEKSNAS